jgi:hypothetical protein
MGWIVVKKHLILIISILYMAGCQSDKSARPDLDSQILSVSNNMAEFLRQKHLSQLDDIKAWKNTYGPGLKLTTAHYEIYTTIMEPLTLTRIPKFMESAYRAYNSQLPEPVETKLKFTVYLFSNRRQWEHFTYSFAGEQAELFCKIKAGAYYHNGVCVAYDIDKERTFATLAHEGWHQFNSRIFKYRLPSWLDEGVATLFEAYHTEDGMIYFEPAANTNRLDALRKTLKNDRMLPLRELTAINPGQVLSADQTEGTMAFYSQSYALIRFLQQADNGKRLGVYNKLLADGLRGNWPLDRVSKKIAIDRNLPKTILWNHLVGQQLFQEYIDSDFDRIEQEYLAFCRQITQY